MCSPSDVPEGQWKQDGHHQTFGRLGTQPTLDKTTPFTRSQAAMKYSAGTMG